MEEGHELHSVFFNQSLMDKFVQMFPQPQLLSRSTMSRIYIWHCEFYEVEYWIGVMELSTGMEWSQILEWQNSYYACGFSLFDIF